VSARTRRGSATRPIGWSAASSHRTFLLGSATSSPSHRRTLARRVRSGSIWTRARSIIRPNGTCEGQTSSHARHARQRSMKRANASSGWASPSATERIAVIRPRGDADSSPVTRYVGQWGRHNPQATQAARSSSAGASSGNRHAGSRPGGGPTKRTPSGISAPSTRLGGRTSSGGATCRWYPQGASAPTGIDPPGDELSGRANADTDQAERPSESPRAHVGIRAGPPAT